MKSKNHLAKRTPWGRHFHILPLVLHGFEVLAALLIIGGSQHIWAQIVGADPDITPPSVPANVQMTGRSANTVDLSWDASTDDVGVTGYKLYRNGSFIATTTGTTQTDAGLTPNTNYSYTLTAFDAANNESAQSSTLSVTTLADTSPPSVPTSLRQTGQTINSVTLAWNASTDNVGVTGYDIYRNGLLVKSQAGTTFTDTGLAVYSGYTYNVTAHDGSNNASNLSPTLYAYTSQDVTPPSVPDSVQKTGSTVSSISLSWSASSDDVGVVGYHIYRDGLPVGSTAGTNYTDSGLTVSSNYTYTIAAYDAAANTSAQSVPFSTASSNDTAPPTIPSSLHTTTLLDTSISFAWTASTDDVAVTGYKIYRNGSLIGTRTQTNFTDSGLTPITDYAYTVQAYDAAGNTSASSAFLNTQTAYDTTPPAVPTNLHNTGVTDTTVSLQWDAATDNVAVAGYDIYRDGVLLTSTIGTSFTDSGLSVHHAYGYQVRAHDAANNNSGQTTVLNVTTLTDQVAPTSPTNLASSSQTTTSIDLTWHSATDDVGVANYRLYRNGIAVTTFNSTAYTDTSLHYNRQYTYTVTALDAAGNESPISVALAVSTLPDTTVPSVSLTAPTNNQVVQYTIPMNATASDDLELAHIDLYVDSTQVATCANSPCSLSWNSYNVHNGTHTVTAKATDASGNFATQAVTISVNNPPPPLAGDLNGDHKVNIFDLSILLSHWNRSGAGDFNNNGRVDIFDLSVLLARYGQDNSNYH